MTKIQSTTDVNKPPFNVWAKYVREECDKNAFGQPCNVVKAYGEEIAIRQHLKQNAIRQFWIQFNKQNK